MPKRKAPGTQFKEIAEKIKNGEYSVKAVTDFAKFKPSVTWEVFKRVYNQNNEVIPDNWYCSSCCKLYELQIRNSGQTLRRHAERCKTTDTPRIATMFTPKFSQTSKRFKKEDKELAKDAAITYIIKDMRPIR